MIWTKKMVNQNHSWNNNLVYKCTLNVSKIDRCKLMNHTNKGVDCANIIRTTFIYCRRLVFILILPLCRTVCCAYFPLFRLIKCKIETFHGSKCGLCIDCESVNASLAYLPPLDSCGINLNTDSRQRQWWLWWCWWNMFKVWKTHGTNYIYHNHMK